MTDEQKPSAAPDTPRAAGSPHTSSVTPETETPGPGTLRRRAVLPWLVPLLLLVGVGAGIWWFVLRDTAVKRVQRLMGEARTAYDLFEYTRAEQLLLQARDMIPEGAKGSDLNVGLNHNLGMLYRQQERWDEAHDAFMRAATLCGPNANEVRAEELFQVAEIAIHVNRPVPAGQALEAAITAHPTRRVLHLSLLDLQLGYLKQPAQADSTLRRFMRLCGRTPENLRDAAGIYYRRKFLPDSILLAKAAAAAEDTMITAHVIVAKSLWRSGRAQEGLEYIEGPMSRYPKDVSLWSAHASLLIGAGRAAEAVQSADRAIELGPENYDAHRVRMMALYNANRFDDALAQAMTCRKMTKDPREAQFLESMMARIRSRQQGKSDVPGNAAEGGARDDGS